MLLHPKAKTVFKFLIVAASLALASCANNNPPSETLPPLSFKTDKPFMLNVAKIEIQSKFNSSSTPPHIEMVMPVSPENALHRWVEDQILPRGTSGTMRVVINNASATETPIKKDDSVSDIFGKRQISQVDMAADITLQILDDRQFVTAEVTGHASRGRTLPEGLKLNERDRILYDMVVDMVKSLGQSMEPQIRDNFSRWIVIQ